MSEIRSGIKVKFLGCSQDQINWGNNDDPSMLIKGQVYYIEYVDVHSYHTKIQLRGIVGKFNSVCFEVVD